MEEFEPRFDFAVFSADDQFLNNALLTLAEAERWRGDGFRLVRVLDEAWQNLPAFRGRRNVAPRSRYRGWRG